jgi:hypothetical protein
LRLTLRLQGVLSNLGKKITGSTIADILQRHDIEPAPERNRKTTWKEFLSVGMSLSLPIPGSRPFERGLEHGGQWLRGITLTALPLLAARVFGADMDLARSLAWYTVAAVWTSVNLAAM